jgi:transposase
MRSLEKHRDNPSVLHNAGQLAAWYDSTLNPPKVSDRARRTLSQMKKELAGKKPYSSAYEEIKSACARRALLTEQLEKKVAVIEAEVLPVRKAGMELDSQMREVNDEIDRCKRTIDELWRELRTGVVYRDVDGHVVYRRHNRWRRDELYERINQEERSVERLKSERRRIRSRSNTLLVELKDKEAQLDRLGRQVRSLKVGTDRIFRWDPPAVDGVFTPEAAHFPISTRPAAPRDPETQASQRLKLARLYLRHKMNDKATVILEGILEDYGSTKAAKEAKILLVELKSLE